MSVHYMHYQRTRPAEHGVEWITGSETGSRGSVIERVGSTVYAHNACSLSRCFSLVAHSTIGSSLCTALWCLSAVVSVRFACISRIVQHHRGLT